MEITEINGDFSVLDKNKSLARTDRNKRLTETDWWGASDLIMTDAQTAYRQALRDVPSQEGFPDNISWPTKPE
jgi:hypothetical protein